MSDNARPHLATATTRNEVFLGDELIRSNRNYSEETSERDRQRGATQILDQRATAARSR